MNRNSHNVGSRNQAITKQTRKNWKRSHLPQSIISAQNVFISQQDALQHPPSSKGYHVSSETRERMVGSPSRTKPPNDYLNLNEPSLRDDSIMSIKPSTNGGERARTRTLDVVAKTRTKTYTRGQIKRNLHSV